MRLTLTLLLLAALRLSAQSALHIDISGEWRTMRGDDSRYAARGFDDSDWSKVQLPWTRHPDYGSYWLRRSASIPDWADTSQLVLTLGTINEIYEVYLNGTKIGASGEFSIQAKQIARPRSFPIPQAVAAAGNPIVIAVRVWNYRGIGSITWEIFADGPYLITYPSGVDPNWGQASINKRSLRQSPDLVTSAAELTLALMLLIAWLAERKRHEVLLLALYLMVEVAYSSTMSGLVSAGTHPWSWGLFFSVCTALRIGLFADFCLHSLCIESRWIRVIVWLLAISSLTNYSRNVTFGSLEAVTLGIVGFAWWRLIRGRAPLERHVLAGLLLCVLAAQSNRRGLLLFPTNRVELGRYAWSIHEVSVWVLAFSIAVILLRRLIADRRERLRLAGELEAARVLQQLLLKHPAMHEPDLSIEAVYQPAEEVGGDFYYVLDGRVVVLGDVSGKGLKAAMLVSLLIGVLRGTRERTSAGVLAALNRAAAGQMEHGFITCCCARFDAGGVVTIANAGQLSPYLDGAEAAIEPGLPLGLVAEVVYEETTITLAPGGSLTFLSDGVVEASNAKDGMFGFDRTRKIGRKPAGEIAEAARAWGQNDDITVVSVRRAG
jgi:sigma-B regulation protein RsbU (phosphoserine phosphatase)